MNASRLPLTFIVPLALAGCPTDDTQGDSETESNGTTTGMSATSPSSSATSPSTTASTTATTTDESSSGEPSTGEPSTGEPSTGSSSTGPVCNPDIVELTGDTFFPEGIAAHSDGSLYVGSLTTGEIARITPCASDTEEHLVEVFNDGTENELATVGLVVDEASNVLWACSSDFTGALPGAILGFSLDDGSLVATHAFDAGICNDLTLDGDGNLYATESLASRIMRVVQADLIADTDAEEWSTDTLYQVAPGELGLNGIVFNGADAIMTVNLTTGELYSTVIEGNGDAANPALVDLGATVLAGPDGLELEAPDTFIVVENAGPALTRVTLGDGGNTVEVIDSAFDVPTTAAIVGTDAWIVESQLDHLLDPDGAGPPEPPFVIVRRPL